MTWETGPTRGGKIFSAARRGTEKPPWVLVSLAVSCLQKNSGCGLLDLRARSDLSNASLSSCPYNITNSVEFGNFGTSRIMFSESPATKIVHNYMSEITVVLGIFVTVNGAYRRYWLKCHLSIYFIRFRVSLGSQSQIRDQNQTVN